MAFPDDILNIKVEIAPAGTWIDVTSYVYLDDIVITRGSADETTQAQPTKCTFRLNNIDGRFSPRNPNSPYYGSLGRNTPVLVSVAEGDRFLNVTGADSSARVSDTAQLDITGDIDIRVDATLKDWSGEGATGNQMHLIGKWTASTQQSWLLVVFITGKLTYRWSVDGSAITGAIDSTATPVPDASGRLAVRVTHDVDNGAGGNTVTFYTAPTIDGPWEQLGDPVVTAGTTSIFNSTAPLAVGTASNYALEHPYGKIWAAKVFNGISGTVAADIDFRTQTVGDTSFTGADGLTWTTSGAATISNQYNRFRGEAVAWPARWTTGGFDSWVPMVAESLVRRINQGEEALGSAMARRIPTDADVLGYWPMEDGEDSTSLASGLAGGTPITFLGDITPQAHPGPPGSADLPTFGTGCSFSAPVPGPVTAGNAWKAEWLMNLQQVTATERTTNQFQGSGTVITWSFMVYSGGVRIRGLNRSGTLVVNQAIAFDVSGTLNLWVRWSLYAVQNGANVDWSVGMVPLTDVAGTAFDASFAGSVGRITAVAGSPGLSADIDGLAMGHLGVFNSNDTNIYQYADIGFSSESAWDRLVRLTGEESIPLTVVGDQSDTAAMGAQRPDKLIDLLREATDADAGILGDSRDQEDETSFKFISRNALYNQPVRLELGYESDGEVHAPLDPTDDDQYTRNRVTAERERGSTAVVEVTDGPLGSGTIGRYNSQVTVNIEKDDRLADYAGWYAHLGTWDEERYPTVLVKVQAAPGLANEVLAVDQGSRIRLVDARGDDSETEDRKKRTWIPPGEIDLLVRGYTETLSQFTWEVEYQCVPARPYDVAEVDQTDQQVQHIDTDGTELSEAVDTTETAIEVFTTSGPTWTDEVENMPFDWMIGGEAMTVIAPGALMNDNALFSTSVTGWTAVACTSVHSTAIVHPDPLAVGSAKITPDGVTASGGINLTTRTAVGSITPGATYTVSCWVYAVVAHTDVRTAVDWYDSSDAFLSSSLGSASSVPAGAWTYLEQTLTAPASASRAASRFRFGGTPASTKIFYVWDLTIARTKASLVYDQFGRTATDTWTTADSSQSWTNTGTAADYDVLSGYGRHINPATSTAHESYIANTEADSEIYCDITTAAAATGASLFGGAMARYADTNNLYEARMEFTTGNVATLSVRKRVASVETQLGTFTLFRAHAAGTFVRVRFQVIGSALKAKAWRVGDPEPDPWQIEVTDTALSAAGSVGVRSVRNAGNTNANAEFRFDNFELANPQVYSVVRSANGVVKSHSSGAAVVLRYPMILAL